MSTELTNAARDVLEERQRQIDKEGWTPEHDDEHKSGEMARAAAVYANPEIWNVFGATNIGWPWGAAWFKPTDRRRDLVKAGALILAEIERLDRASGSALYECHCSFDAPGKCLVCKPA